MKEEYADAIKTVTETIETAEKIGDTEFISRLIGMAQGYAYRVKAQKKEAAANED